MNKPILCLDFDGVIHSYKSRWQGATIIPDPPVPGVLEFMRAALEHFRVGVYSSRSGQPGGIDAMRAWLEEQAVKALNQELRQSELNIDWLSEIEWPTEKPAAFVTIDDRAITFDGTWPSIGILKAFKPWNKR